jgi:hypothetical protein
MAKKKSPKVRKSVEVSKAEPVLGPIEGEPTSGPPLETLDLGRDDEATTPPADPADEVAISPEPVVELAATGDAGAEAEKKAEAVSPMPILAGVADPKFMATAFPATVRPLFRHVDRPAAGGVAVGWSHAEAVQSALRDFEAKYQSPAIGLYLSRSRLTSFLREHGMQSLRLQDFLRKSFSREIAWALEREDRPLSLRVGMLGSSDPDILLLWGRDLQNPTQYEFSIKKLVPE